MIKQEKKKEEKNLNRRQNLFFGYPINNCNLNFIFPSFNLYFLASSFFFKNYYLIGNRMTKLGEQQVYSFVFF